MFLTLTVALTQLFSASPGPGELPKGCAVRPVQDFEAIQCDAAVGYSHTGRKDVFTREGMEE